VQQCFSSDSISELGLPTNDDIVRRHFREP
jgi:hypothetical protein